MAKPIERRSDVQATVPSWLARPIGHIITRFAYVEYHLSRMIWLVLGLSNEQGRVACGDPRAKEKLYILRDLAFHSGKPLPERNIEKLYKALGHFETLRDTLAHAHWVQHDGRWGAIKTRGNIVDQELPKLARNRKLRPEVFWAPEDNFAAIIADIDLMIAGLNKLYELLPVSGELTKASQPVTDTNVTNA